MAKIFDTLMLYSFLMYLFHDIFKPLWQLHSVIKIISEVIKSCGWEHWWPEKGTTSTVESCPLVVMSVAYSGIQPGSLITIWWKIKCKHLALLYSLSQVIDVFTFSIEFDYQLYQQFWKLLFFKKHTHKTARVQMWWNTCLRPLTNAYFTACVICSEVWI